MSRNNVNAMAERYKAEMMRMYSHSPDKGAKKQSQPQSKETKPKETAANKPVTEKPHTHYEREIVEDSPPPKFPSPDEILAAEKEGFPPPAVAVMSSSIGQGNYGSAESDIVSEGENAGTVYDNNGKEQTLSEMTGKGYVKAEITTAGGALPVENAIVIITRRENGQTMLVKMLVTDGSGVTELAELPAPDIIYSENPDPESKPFAEYILSIAADGYYAVPEIVLPVFTTVKSIQPVSLVPVAKFDQSGSMPSDGNSVREV